MGCPQTTTPTRVQTPILPLGGRGFNAEGYGSRGWAASHSREDDDAVPVVAIASFASIFGNVRHLLRPCPWAAGDDDAGVWIQVLIRVN